MKFVTTVDVLNRLLVVHHRSLAMYLSSASPTWGRGDDMAREILQAIAADQEETVDRLGEMIVDGDGTVQYGGFPMAFSAYHDLSFEFLLDRLIDHQREDITKIEDCVALLNQAPLAKALAQETLGAAKGHLDTLLTLTTGAES